MNQVEELIVRALNTTHNNELRMQAESAIFGLLRESPADFFATCAAIVVSEDKSEKMRQSAASVLKAILARQVRSRPLRPKTGSSTGT